MKISVRVKEEWLYIPCGDGKLLIHIYISWLTQSDVGSNTIRWLGEEAWKKYQKLLQGIKIENYDIINVIQEVRKTRGGALLDPDDTISEVLDNDDFVNIGKPLY